LQNKEQYMWSNFRNQVMRMVTVASLLSLTACGGGGGTSLTEAKAPSITLTATSFELPVQNSGYTYPDETNRYNSRVTATVRDNKGNVVSTGGAVTFTVSGGKTSVGALYESDYKTKVKVDNPDGTTTEHPAAFWGLPVDISGSMAQAVFQAWTQAGTATIVATYTDPNGQSAQASIQIKVGSAVNTGLPSSFKTNVNNLPIYITGQNKNDQAIIDTYLYDPANQLVSSNGSNNIQAQIIGDNLGGASLRGSNGQSGQIVKSQITGSSGLAEITVLSGTESGNLTIRLTADGADNNVDNGIQQAVTKDLTVAISDGRVASLSFGGPYINAIKNNQTSTTLASGDAIDQGTYSRAISVVVQDSNGNPVPNTPIRFGLIDSPLTAGSYPDPNFSPAPPAGAVTSTSFAIQGTKGNPVEGGTQFDEQDGVNLVTMGVRPLDRLILVPSAQGTQRDLLGSRIIDNLLAGSTSAVTTTTSFPYPVTPGFVDGYNIPWVIGRAQYGNIGATATTDANGVATTFITYPVSRLDQPAILTAEADNGVSAVIGAYYVGVAGGTLTSSVTSVPAGATTDVTMCATDANNAPLPNYPITAGLPSTVKTDPSSLTTGPNGCASFKLDTNAVPAGTPQFDIPFSIGTGANESVKITVAAAQTAANISIQISGPTGTDPNHARKIAALVTDSNGNPLSGQTVVFSFPAPTDDGTSPIAAITSPAGSVSETTGTNGMTPEVTVNYTGNAPGATPPPAGDNYSVTATVGSNSTTQSFPY
jgi:hypothetical protein